ncbi:MAG: choice-of-anchor D domain-containing protein, partial [Verrucomicrobiota bacterium]
PAGVNLTDGTSTIDFGDVGIGGNVSRTFTIKDAGSVQLTGLAITFDGTHSSEFVVTTPPTVPVVPNGSTVFTVKFTPTALGPRTAMLHIASNDPDENPFDVTLTGTATTNLEAWRLQHFGSPDNSGDGADTNDFEFDGLSNLLEFATGNDPKQSSIMPGYTAINNGTIEFFYTRSKAAINDGFVFNIEWSDNLASPNWSIAGVSEEIVDEDDVLQQIKASIPLGVETQKFMRLRVTRP